MDSNLNVKDGKLKVIRTSTPVPVVLWVRTKRNQSNINRKMKNPDTLKIMQIIFINETYIA